MSSSLFLPRIRDNNNLFEEIPLNKTQKSFSFYCISCFNKIIWNNDLYSLRATNPEIISIENIYKEEVFYDKNYEAILHKVILNDKIKKINLILSSEDNKKKWFLNEINIRLDKEMILFVDLEINQNNLFQFVNDLKEEINIDNKNNLDQMKISRTYNSSEKLKIYLKYFKANKAKDLEENLVKQYLSLLKEDNHVIFSDIIEIFNLSFGTKEIANFLDTYTKLDYDLDDKYNNKEFNDLLNLYKKDKTKFFEKNEKYFVKVKNKEKKNAKDIILNYRNLLENFITIYQLFYEESTIIEKQRLNDVREILLCLFNNKSDIISYMNFIILKFDSFYRVLITNKEKIKIQASLIQNKQIESENFLGVYELLIGEQKKKEVFIFDFSEIFNYLLDKTNNFQELIMLKKRYKKELKFFQNNYFENNYNTKIHYIGMKNISNGEYNNSFLIHYIKKDQYFVNKKTKNDGNKKYDILKYFNIELMDDKFFEIFHQNKIYSYFEEDYALYLEKLYENVKEMKYFGYFFKLLPIEKYNKEAIIFVVQWLKSNIKTFEIQNSKNFKNEIKILFEILYSNKIYSYLYIVNDSLKENLGEYSKEIFIFLLNSLDKSTNHLVIESIINHILFSDRNHKEENEILNGVIKLLEKVHHNKTTIAKIILSQIKDFSINYEDFYEEKSQKFSLFEKLLNIREYSILNEENRDEIYWENSKYTCQIILKDLKKLNILYTKILIFFNILNDRIIKKRITNVFQCLNENDIENKVVSLLRQINEIKNTWNKNTKTIEKLKEYYNFVYNKNSKIIDELSEYNKKIMNSTLQYLNSKKAFEEFSKYEKEIENVQLILNLKKSYIFLNIFNNFKGRINSNQIVDLSLKKFNSIKNIFINDKEKIEKEIKKNAAFRYLISLGYQNIGGLNEEIDFLLTYFQIFNFNYKDFLLEKIRIIIENKSLISVISGIILLFKVYKKIFNYENERNNDFYKEFKEFRKVLKTQEIISEETSKKINISFENKFNISFNNQEYRKNFFNFFIAINQYPNSIEFIIDKKYEQIKNLNEFLLESDDTPLKEENINDFIKVVKFFENLIKNIEKNDNKEFFFFVKQIIDGIMDNEICGKSLNNYIEKYNYIESLFNKYLNHTEGCVKIIKYILKESDFTIELNIDELSKKNNNFYSIKGKYLNPINNNSLISNSVNLYANNERKNNKLEKNISKQINYIFIFYRDLESLFQRVYISNIPEVYKEDINIFKEFFKNSKEIIYILNKLYIKGYPEDFLITLNFENSRLYCKYKNEQSINIIDLLKSLSELENNVSKEFKKSYFENGFIKFFRGRQLNLIYNNIINKNENNNLDLFNSVFVNYFKTLQINTHKSDNFVGCNKFSFMIKKIDLYIEKQFYYNNKKIYDIYELNKIKVIEKPIHSKNSEIKKNEKNNEYKGIYFYMTHGNQEVESLNAYIFLTRNLPLNIFFLYCSKDTTSEELILFLNRCFVFNFNILFCIVNTNLLNNYVRRKFIAFIKYFSKKCGLTMKSCLLIIFSGNDDYLHKFLIKTKNIKVFPKPYIFSSDNIFFQNFINDYKIKIIKSSNCGLGKSELIKNQKRKINTHYIYFPIGGVFNRNNIIKRLVDLPDMSDIKQNYTIHFDITQTNNIELLNEFFFNLIIFRKCDLNENCKYFGKNVEIIIEVPNDFKDYTKEVGILSKLTEETIDKIGNIHPSEELTTVANMLTMLESDDILKRQSEIKKIILKLNNEQCSSIVLKYIKNIKVENPNYFQIKIFIKVLYDEFIKFSNCEGYTVETLINNAIGSGMPKKDALNLKYLRKFIIKSLVQVTQLFLIGPYESLIKSQEINQKLLNENEEGKERFINNQLKINIDSISFDEIKPSLVVFNEDGGSCTIITTCSEEDAEFKDLEQLYWSQNKLKIGKLRSFRKLQNKEILDNLLNFINVKFNNEQKKEILGNYVYTPDNFIKVILILLRIRVKIPVIMMGETGCGKTTLIEMASKLINKGKIEIKKMNIHAGITDQDIINFLENTKEEVSLEDRKLLKKKKDEFNSQSEENRRAYLKNNSIEKIYEGYEKEIKNRKIWIFFDEINTCNSMGLFIEIFCKNSIYGKPLDKRYIFIGACNPYRVSERDNKVFNILYKKKHKKKSLVYTVNPLPLSLLNFVFNFGSLKEKDELIYINSMISEVIDNLFNNKIYSQFSKEKEKLVNSITKSVAICQQYMKKNNDISIVSLREVKRFNRFFEFFINYIIDRKNNETIIQNSFEEDEITEFYIKKSNIEIFYCAINLSLYICYYLRLPDKESRKELENLLNKEKIFSDGDFLKVPILEQNYMLNNFDIPKGIAKNRNLKENIFIFFFCIINQIPIITCGKPGRSKTLSFKIIQNSMKGQASKTNFCKQYKEITVFQIQGSITTTSEEIIAIFKKGREYQNNNLDKKITVIFIDELGLAEISENNPLKVMHAELEKEKDTISFVGISNWFIDASKMNRVVYNVVQDPDEEDLIETGLEIAKSYESKGENYIQIYEDIIVRLSKAYYKFITKKKNENDKDQFFFGSRDFYSLIKSVINDIIKNISSTKKFDKEKEDDKNILLNKICIKYIIRNFGGLENSVDEFIRYFFDGYENINYFYNIKNCFSHNTLKCIEENMKDSDSRYLLLIVDNYISQELLNYILEEINVDVMDDNILENKEREGIEIFTNKNEFQKKVIKKYFLGSKFNFDKNNIIYSNEMLNKIKYQMETNNILILKDLENVYPSLYELFNQSFTYLNGKKFVHLGQSKSLSLVDDNFKVIVLVDKKQINNQEPPFLNRFEKHIIDFNNLLSQELIDIADNIYNVLTDIIKIKADNKDINLEKKFEKYLYFIREEEIKSLVYIASKKLEIFENNEENIKFIIQFVLEKISPCFSEELMILMTKYEFRNKYSYFYTCIYESYKKNYCYNIRNYLEKLNKETSIIYTYSSIFDDIIIEENEIIRNQNIIFSKKSIKEVNISSISSLEQIDKEIIDFIFNDKKNNQTNLMILKFREENLNKLNNIYYLLNDYRTNSGKNFIHQQSKIVIFVIYLQNSTNNNISYILNCPKILINNLHNKHPNFPEMLISSNKEIIENQLFDINSMINNNIDVVLSNFNYHCLNIDEKKTMCYKETLLFLFKKQKSLQEICRMCLINLIKNEEDYITRIFKEEVLQKDSLDEIDLMNSLYKLINSFIFENLRKIIVYLEKEQILYSVAFNEKLNQNEIIQKYINEYISKISFIENIKKFIWKNTNLNQNINIDILLEQRFPFCQNIFKSLFIYIKKNISEKYLEIDTYFFTINLKETIIIKEQEKYLNESKKLDDNLRFELSKYPIIIDLLNSENEKIISNLFDDCFYAFLNKNSKFTSKYLNLSTLLNLLIQLRLYTRIGNNLNLDFLEKEKIEIYPSFINLIKEEYNNQDKPKNFYLDKFISIINFLQSYSKEIYIILEAYYFLLETVPLSFEKVVKIIKEKKIKMEETKRNPYYSRINKVPFFYIIESICIIIKEKIYDIINNKKNVEKIQSFKTIQNLVKNLLKLEKRFLLFSKDIFTLDILIKIISQVLLNNKNIGLLDLSIETLKIFFNMGNDSSIKNLEGINIMLIKFFKNDLDIYSHLINKILLDYYKSEYNNEIRGKIINTFYLQENVFYYNQLLEYSYPLLDILFHFSSLEPSQNKSEIHKFSENFNKNDDIKKIINEKNIPKLNEIFLYRFEIICDYFFKRILNEKKKDSSQKLCGDLSKEYLKKSIKNFYDQSNEKNIYLNNIYKIYCIAFIKRYMNYFVDIIYQKDSCQQFYEREEVNEIFYLNEVPQKKTIAIYCLKILLKKFKDWESFKNYYFQNLKNDDDNFGFKKFQNIKKLEDDESFISVPILLLDSNKNINLEYNEFLSKNNFDKDDKIKFNNLFLKNNSYEFLFSLLSNILILYFYTCPDKTQNKNNYKKLISLIMEHLNKEAKIIDNDILIFINTIFLEKNFNDKIIQNLGIENDQKNSDKKITILLYGLRFVLSILVHSKEKKDGFYFDLITKNISAAIESSFIPGNFPNYNLKMESFNQIKKLLILGKDSYGAYLCSCGYHYSIDKCTFPTREFQCPNCQQMIGGKNHKIVRREGHIRIFFDKESMMKKLKHSYADKEVPYKLLSQLEEEVNKEKNELFKGLKAPKKKIFIKRQEKIRQMDEISYRFLNYLLYSFLFYSNIKDFIKSKNLNKYLVKHMTCFEMMEKDWEIMNDILENVPVEIFLNLIFEDIINKLINCPNLKIKEESLKFEKEINDIVVSKIKDKELIKELNKKNNDIININPNSIKAIIQELYSYDKYNEKEYPDLKYFNMSDFPSKEHFILKFNSREINKEKYPILNTIINNDTLITKIELMKDLPIINKVCNYMINFVSFRYSRDEAKNILIKKEIQDQEIINSIDEFINIYKKIRPYIKQQGCHEFGDLFIDLKDNLYLNNLCVDSGELGFGLVLLAIYEEMSQWQNSFIDSVINSPNENLKDYKELFNSKIMIQDCEEEHILNFPNLNFNFKEENKNKDERINLMETIINNSIRKENEVIYDYDEIEDYLAINILPKIKSFKSEYRKVIYQYECFVGDRSSIIINFIEKYEQRELNDNEMKNIINYIIDNKNNKKFNIKNILFSIQVLIDVILDKSPNKNESLYRILKDIENNPNIEIIKNFFENLNEMNEKNENKIEEENNYFNVGSLISVIDILELFCWENIKNNLDKRYLEEINQNIKMQFDSYYDNNEEKNNKIIKKIDLCSAIRKFISRYLSGKSEENISPRSKLKSYLVNLELWPINFAESNIIEEEIKRIFGEVDIEVSYSFKLYEYLGGDIIILDNLVNKYMEKKEEKKYEEQYEKEGIFENKIIENGKIINIDKSKNNNIGNNSEEEDEKGQIEEDEEISEINGDDDDDGDINY